VSGLVRAHKSHNSSHARARQVKTAVKMLQAESVKVDKAMAKVAEQAAHLRGRAELTQHAAKVARELEAAELRLMETRIMLGKESAKKADEKITGALGARMYAVMMKRGIKISEVANKAHGRIDRKEFRATVGTLVPAASVNEINSYFDTFDIDSGGTLDNEELRACLVGLQKAAAVAKKQESVLSARAALLRLAARMTQEDVHKALDEDKGAAAAAAAVEREAAEKEAKVAEEKAAFEARVAARKKPQGGGVSR